MKDINIKIKESGVKEIQKLAQNHLIEQALEVEATAKELVPVRTGALRDSIQVFPTSDPNIQYIGSDLPYALAIELGTVKMPPQPYLRTALSRLGGK